ncbi:MAG: hypothetical protein MJ100_10025, partial [Ruminococcus sp.]|nr:hypothetical protein [Ruminococcus sp.]
MQGMAVSMSLIPHYTKLKFILLLLFFVNAFVGDGVLDVPKSPLYKIEVYSSIVTLYETVSCPPKRGTSWAKGRGQRKTGT